MTRHWFGASLMLLSLSSAAHAQSVLTLERTPAGYFVAPLYLGDAGPFPFLPDTAASHSAIAQPLALQHGYELGPEPTEDVQTLTALVQAERHPVGPVRLGDIARDELGMVVVDAPHDTNWDIQGLIGADLFAGRTIRLDLARGVLDLDAAPPHYEDAQFHTDRRVLTTQGRAWRVPDPIAVLVDTGSPVTIINGALAGRAMPQVMTMRTTLAGVTRLDDYDEESENTLRVRNLRVGGLCVNMMRVVEADLDVFDALGWRHRPAMVLGLDVLQHAVITVDYTEGVAEVSPGHEALDCRAAPRLTEASG